MKVWVLSVYEGDVEDTYGHGSWYVETIRSSEESIEKYIREFFPTTPERNLDITEWTVHE